MRVGAERGFHSAAHDEAFQFGTGGQAALRALPAAKLPNLFIEVNFLGGDDAARLAGRSGLAFLGPAKAQATQRLWGKTSCVKRV